MKATKVGVGDTSDPTVQEANQILHDQQNGYGQFSRSYMRGLDLSARVHMVMSYLNRNKQSPKSPQGYLFGNLPSVYNRKAGLRGYPLWPIIHVMEKAVTGKISYVDNPRHFKLDYTATLEALKQNHPKSMDGNVVKALQLRFDTAYSRLLERWAGVSAEECREVLAQSLRPRVSGDWGAGSLATKDQVRTTLYESTDNRWRYDNAVVVYATWEALKLAGNKMTREEYDRIVESVFLEEVPKTSAAILKQNFSRWYDGINGIKKGNYFNDEDSSLSEVITEIVPLETIDFSEHTLERIKRPYLMPTHPQSAKLFSRDRDGVLGHDMPYRIHSFILYRANMRQWGHVDPELEDIFKKIQDYWAQYLTRRIEAMQIYMDQYGLKDDDGIYTGLRENGLLSDQDISRYFTNQHEYFWGDGAQLRSRMGSRLDFADHREKGGNNFQPRGRIDMTGDTITFRDLLESDKKLLKTVMDDGVVSPPSENNVMQDHMASYL